VFAQLSLLADPALTGRYTVATVSVDGDCALQTSSNQTPSHYATSSIVYIGCDVTVSSKDD